MKHLNLLALVFLLGSFSAFAQEANDLHTPTPENESTTPAPTLWLNFGGSFADLSQKDYDNYSIRSGVTFGAELEVPINRMFSVQAGVDYVQKGAGFSGYNYPSGKDVFNYIEVPLLFRFNLYTGRAHFGFFAGPYLAFATSRSEQYDDGSPSADLSDLSRSFDIGIREGASFVLPLGNILSAQFTFESEEGLVNLNKGVNYNNNRITNFNLMPTIGIGVAI